MNARENGKSEKQPLTPYNVSVTKIRPGISAIGGNAGELNTPDDNDSDLKLPRVQTLLTPAILTNRIWEWGDKLILKKIDPWAFFHGVGVKIRKYDGQLIHYSTGLSFEGSPGHIFWNFIEPFLERGIDEWLEHIADLCLQNAKPPELYLETVKSSLLSCISNVYTRMSEIDYKIRKGEASCLASANFGQNTRGRDTSENRAPMISYLNRTYERVLEATKTSANEIGNNTRQEEDGGHRNVAALVTSLIMILLFEMFVYVGPVPYFRNHPRTYVIQAITGFLTSCLTMGVFMHGSKRWWWWGAAITFLAALLSVL